MKINQFSTLTLPQQAIKETSDSGRPVEAGGGRTHVRADQMLKGVVMGKTPTGYLVQTDSGVLTASSLIPLEIGREFWFERLGGSDSALVSASPQKAIPVIMRSLLPLLGVGGGENPFAALFKQGEGAATAEVNNLLAPLADYGVGPMASPIKLLAFIAAMNQVSPGDTALLNSIMGLVDDDRDGQAGQTAKVKDGGVAALSKLFDAHAQLNNLVQSSQQNQGLFLFPCFFAGASGWGEWLFSFTKEEGGAEDAQPPGYGISFYLTMSRLGDLHLQLAGKGKALQGVFSLPSREAATHVNANLDQLLPILERLYKPVTLSCRCESVNNLHMIKDDLSRKVGMSGDLFTLVDVTA